MFTRMCTVPHRSPNPIEHLLDALTGSHVAAGLEAPSSRRAASATKLPWDQISYLVRSQAALSSGVVVTESQALL